MRTFSAMLPLSLLVSGCLAADEPELASTDQALNGDTWTTVDDNPYTGGEGAEYYGIAASPATHKVLVAGNRTEASGANTWIVRGSPAGSSGFGLNHTLKLPGGANSEATNVAADATGVWYVLGDSQDASGAWHWIVIRSADDAMTWQKPFDVVLTGRPTGITVDQQLNVYISGTTVDASGAHAKIFRGAMHGTSWSQVASFDAVSGGNIALSGLCTGAYNGVQEVFAVGGISEANVNHASGWVLNSANQGTTWSTTFIYKPLEATYGQGCTGTPGADVDFAFAAMDNAGTSRWDVLDATGFAPLVYTHDAVTLPGDLTGAFGVTYAASRPYAVGRYSEPSGTHWHVRFKSGITWLDSDAYVYPGTSYESDAEAAAYDSERGLYVAGKAFDDTGRLHGIVRHRL